MSRSLIHRSYSIMASFQNTGERILFSFASLYADIKGASPAAQGVMLSLQNILAFIGQQYFGKASDRLGRPLIIGLGWVISVVSSILIFQFSDPWLIIAIFALYNIGFSMVQPAWNALIGDTYPGKERAVKLGTIGSAATLLGGVMYLSAGLISDLVPYPFAFLFVCSAISFSMALLVVIVLSLRDLIPERENTTDQGLSLFDPLTRHSGFRRFVLIDTTFAMVMSLSWPLFPRATNALATPSQVTVIWFFTFLGFSVTARFNTQIRGYVGSYHRSLFFSRAIMFSVPLTFAFATNWTQILLVRTVTGASFGFYSILQKDYILETCERLGRGSDRGWFLGSHSFVWGILTFAGSLFSGLVAEYFIVTRPGIAGYSELFVVAAVLRLFAVSLYLKVPNLVDQEVF